MIELEQKNPTCMNKKAGYVPAGKPHRPDYNQRTTSDSYRPPEQPKRSRSQVIEPSTNVFISYIPPEFTEQDLRNLCSKYGEILCSKIMINLETGQSRCFGFVRFKELSQSTAAIRGIDGMEIGNKKLLAKYAESQEKKEIVSNTLFVKRIPLSVDIDLVQQLFSRFGTIISVLPQYSTDSIEPIYWRCFIRYTNKSSATLALDSMNNQIISHGTMPIHVTYADDSKRNLNTSTIPQNIIYQQEIPAEDQRNLLPRFFFDN